MSRMTACLYLLGMIAVTECHAQGPPVIIIKAVNAKDQLPVPYYTLTAEKLNRAFIGNADGILLLPADNGLKGRDTALFSSIGYIPQKIAYTSLVTPVTDTIIVRLEPFTQSLPDVVIRRIDIDRVLTTALSNSFMRYMPFQEASVFIRMYRQRDGRFTGLLEAMGKRYEPGIDQEMFIGSRVSHNCQRFDEIRSTGFDEPESEATFYPDCATNFVFVNYFLRYAYPFGHEMYRKKIDWSYQGDENMIVLVLEPDTRNRDLVKAGRKISLNYGNFFLSSRRYHISLDDTTIRSISLSGRTPDEAGWGKQKFILHESETEYRFRKVQGFMALTYAGERRQIRSTNNRTVSFTETNEMFFFDVSQKPYTDEELKSRYFLTIIDNRRRHKQFGTSNYSRIRKFCNAVPSHISENPSFWKSFVPPFFDYNQLKNDIGPTKDTGLF